MNISTCTHMDPHDYEQHTYTHTHTHTWTSSRAAMPFSMSSPQLSGPLVRNASAMSTVVRRNAAVFFIVSFVNLRLTYHVTITRRGLRLIVKIRHKKAIIV